MSECECECERERERVCVCVCVCVDGLSKGIECYLLGGFLVVMKSLAVCREARASSNAPLCFSVIPFTRWKTG